MNIFSFSQITLVTFLSWHLLFKRVVFEPSLFIKRRDICLVTKCYACFLSYICLFVYLCKYITMPIFVSLGQLTTNLVTYIYVGEYCPLNNIFIKITSLTTSLSSNKKFQILLEKYTVDHLYINIFHNILMNNHLNHAKLGWVTFSLFYSPFLS